jgi:hypothetical protein
MRRGHPGGIQKIVSKRMKEMGLRVFVRVRRGRTSQMMVGMNGRCCARTEGLLGKKGPLSVPFFL